MMENLFNSGNFYELYLNHQLIVMLIVMIISFYPIVAIIKHLFLPKVYKILGKRDAKYQTVIDQHNLSGHIIRVILAIYLVFWGDIFDRSTLMNAVSIRIKDIIILSYIIITITSLMLTLINIARDLYNSKALSKKIPIGLHTQILKIFIVVCAILAIVSLVLSISISSLFTSIGAAAALLTFVFKDAVVGLIASLQVTMQNIVRVGDWVTLPEYNADGDVQKITIAVVIIRNFDNTHTTVPTSAFLNAGVKNWSPMFELGGRRIKRSVSIDMDTVKICDQNELKTIKNMPNMMDFAINHQHLFDKSSNVTNLSMFRHYINEYLRAHQGIHQTNFTFLVRALDPTPQGIPIEVYVFTKDTNWANYEEIQAEIFEHLLGVLPSFKLKAFQALVER